MFSLFFYSSMILIMLLQIDSQYIPVFQGLAQYWKRKYSKDELSQWPFLVGNIFLGKNGLTAFQKVLLSDIF